MTSNTRRLYVLLLVAAMSVVPLYSRAASEIDGRLVVGAVQFAVSESVYRSIESFESAVEASLDKVEAEAGDKALDLVVFPEYTSAFLGLSVMTDRQIWKVVSTPGQARELAKQAIQDTERDMLDFWRKTARERGYAILAGTTIVFDDAGRPRNRALLFDRKGRFIWHQDKVFISDPETRLLNLKSGRIGDAAPFRVDDYDIALTICRDTYHRDWEEYFPAADLWVDIKANELPYTRDYYDGALPARLPNSRISRGLTVSLSGGILGYRFTGPTEYLYNIGPIAGTDPWGENETLVIVHPPETTDGMSLNNR